MSSRRPVAPRSLARPATPVPPATAEAPAPAAAQTAVDVLDRTSAAERTAEPATTGTAGSGTGTGAARSGKAARSAKPATSRRVRVRTSSRPDRGSAPARPDRRGRSPRPGREEPEEERPPRTVTMRSLVLALVILVAFIVLAPTARAFIVQTEHLRRVTAESAAVEAQVSSLEDQLRRWSDVSYVKAQARERLGFVLPGETPYRVVDPQTVMGDDGEPYTDLEASISTAPQVPWYLTLRDSVAEAGQEPGDEPDYRTADPAATPTS